MIKTLVNKVMKVINKDEDIFKYLNMFNELHNQSNMMGVWIEEERMTQARGVLEIIPQADGSVDMRITYDDRLTWVEKVITIAHELGHASQVILECDSNYIEWGIYNEVNSILLIEEDAWARSIIVLNVIGFDDWMAFKLYACKCYATYATRHARENGLSNQWVKEDVEDFLKNIEREISRNMSASKEAAYALE